jgi:16S rRNA (cytosine967-C5)-methyltransferase
MVSPPNAAIAPARAAAFDVLRRVFEGGAFADRALHARARSLSARDRALAMRLAYGAVQRRGTLDHFIAALAERDVARLDPPLLAALRLGLYELCWLDGAPDRAVVADAVELAKRAARAGHGLVNAVLRRAVREDPRSLLAGLSDATPSEAAIMHSHPQWIAELWWEYLGAHDARQLMAAANDPSELALRANTLVMDAPTLVQRLRDHWSDSSTSSNADRHPFTARLSPELAEAVLIDGPLDVRGTPLWRSGAYIAQSRAAMLVSRALAPVAGERALDVCAAPGGKTTHIAALMGDRGEVVALERSRTRAEQLARTLTRMHVGSVRVEVGDAQAEHGPRGHFDRVLVDPPCTGLGTLAARADLRWRVLPHDVSRMARAQLKILCAASHALRPGGVLVYSTCTISPTENEHVIADFLDSHADFSVERLSQELPAFALARRVERSPYALTLPHRDRTAGFFIARLRRG